MKKIYLTGFVVGLLVLVMIRVADAAQSVIGSWTYRAGGFSDEHSLYSNGSALGQADIGKSVPANPGNWTIIGNELVVRWRNNGWVNRYRLPETGGRLFGVAQRGSERVDITLTRLLTQSVIGSWTYRAGGFSDVHSLYSNGSALGQADIGKSVPENPGNWTIIGNELVVRWRNNGWVNRYRLPETGGRLFGVAQRGSERVDITLTRQ